MIYAEASYFDGNACQHVADWQEMRRLQGIHSRALVAHDRERRSRAQRC